MRCWIRWPWVAFSAHRRRASRARSRPPPITTTARDDAGALKSVPWPTLGLGMGLPRKRGGMLTTGRESSLAWLGTSRVGRRGLWRSSATSSKTGLLSVVLNLRFFSSKPSFQFTVSKKDHIFYVNNVVLLWLAWILLRYFIVMNYLIVNAWRMSVIWDL